MRKKKRRTRTKSRDIARNQKSRARSKKKKQAKRRGRLLHEKKMELLKKFPAKLNWREHMNEVQEQEDECSACYIFSALSAVQAMVSIKYGDKIDLSEQEILDCNNDEMDGCDGGNPLETMDYIITNGINYERDYPLE